MLKSMVEVQESTAEREIVISRLFDAPRKMVWEAWTDPKQVALWWGPNGFSTTIEQMDVRPGGVWKQVLHGPDGTDYPNESVFLEVVQYKRLVYTMSGGRKGAPVVQMEKIATFEEEAGGTRVTMLWSFRRLMLVTRMYVTTVRLRAAGRRCRGWRIICLVLCLGRFR